MKKRGHFNFLTNLLAKVFGLFPKPVVKLIYHLNRNTSGFVGLGIRYVCATKMAAKCGSNVAIFPNVIIKHWEKLNIGDNVSIHPYCYVDAIGGIDIGDNVSIANHCSLISFGHTWSDPDEPIKYNPLTMNPITIMPDVWIGCGVRVIGDCHISSRTIIAAGAVAKGSLEGYSIYGGIPARKIKDINHMTSSMN